MEKSTHHYKNINLIDLRKKNLLTSEKFFAISKEQFYQGQLSSNDFREAQIDLSLSKNILALGTGPYTVWNLIKTLLMCGMYSIAFLLAA